MTQHEYTLEFHGNDGPARRVSYQGLIADLGVADELVHGAPLKAGGVPQVQSFATFLLQQTKFNMVKVLYNGNTLLVVA
jgi:hypothetical protein